MSTHEFEEFPRQSLPAHEVDLGENMRLKGGGGGGGGRGGGREEERGGREEERGGEAGRL